MCESCERLSAEWVRVWLEGRDKKNLRAYGNAFSLTIVLADVSACEHIVFKISEARRDPSLYKLYHELRSREGRYEDTALTPMLHGWFHAISQN